MVHVYVIIVHCPVYELVLLVCLCHLPYAVAIAVLLDLDSIHLHLKRVVNVTNIIPGAFYKTCMHEVELFVNIETTMIDPVVIVTIEGKL